jgi:hypothetical protein
MSFGLYIVGFIVLIIGLAIGANMMHVPAQWIGVEVIVLIGLGILRASPLPSSAIRRTNFAVRTPRRPAEEE